MGPTLRSARAGRGGSGMPRGRKEVGFEMEKWIQTEQNARDEGRRKVPVRDNESYKLILDRANALGPPPETGGGPRLLSLQLGLRSLEEIRTSGRYHLEIEGELRCYAGPVIPDLAECGSRTLGQSGFRLVHILKLEEGLLVHIIAKA